MALLWSFTDTAALRSAVGVGGKEESESVPPEPGDRLEDGEFLLRLPVSSLIWKTKQNKTAFQIPETDASDPRLHGAWLEGPTHVELVLRVGRIHFPMAVCQGDRAVPTMA